MNKKIEVYEIQMSNKEIVKIKNKYWKSILGNILICTLFGIFPYLINKNGIDLSFSNVLFSIIFGLIFLMTFLNLTGLIIGWKNLRKDIKERIKIKTRLKIKEKSKSNKTNNNNTHRILFEKNEYLTVYNVTKKTYNNLNVGDIIDIEISKFDNWILKIEWNSIDIENKSYLK